MGLIFYENEEALKNQTWPKTKFLIGLGAEECTHVPFLYANPLKSTSKLLFLLRSGASF